MDEKWSKVLIHGSAFFSAFYVSMLVPLVFFLLTKDERIKSLAIQALLFQLVMGVLITVAGVLSVFVIGLPFLIVFWAMTIIVPLIGIVKALSDSDWNYPIVGRWV